MAAVAAAWSKARSCSGLVMHTETRRRQGGAAAVGGSRSGVHQNTGSPELQKVGATAAGRPRSCGQATLAAFPLPRLAQLRPRVLAATASHYQSTLLHSFSRQASSYLLLLLDFFSFQSLILIHFFSSFFIQPI